MLAQANAANIAANTTDIATLQQEVSSVSAGLNVKESVKVASLVNHDLSQAVTEVDGIAVSAGDRVLFKNQTGAHKNGIYNIVAGGVHQ